MLLWGKLLRSQLADYMLDTVAKLHKMVVMARLSATVLRVEDIPPSPQARKLNAFSLRGDRWRVRAGKIELQTADT